MKTRKEFNIERVKEFCKLVNEGNKPNDALIIMSSSTGYAVPLRESGIYWKEKNGTYKAVERLYTERYALFINEKKKYIKKRNDKQYAAQKQLRLKGIKSVDKKVKQATLFNQLIYRRNDKTEEEYYVKYSKEAIRAIAYNYLKQNKTKQLSFIQRVVKSLFKL